MTLEEAVAYAKRVAFKMSKDPEMGSIAGRAAWKAVKTCDDRPMERWIATIVRKYVWDYWRREKRRNEAQKSELWWSEVFTLDEEHTEALTEDQLLLYQKHVLKWPYDVVAREHNVTTYAVRRMLRAAQRRVYG